MQSERMYAALKGLGKEARLVMLPYEAPVSDAQANTEPSVTE